MERTDTPMEIVEDVSSSSEVPPLKWTYNEYYDSYTIFRDKLYQPINKATLIAIDALMRYPECYEKNPIEITGHYSSRKVSLNRGQIEVAYFYRGGNRAKPSSKLHGNIFVIYKNDEKVITKMLYQLETVLKNDFKWSGQNIDENDAPSTASPRNESVVDENDPPCFATLSKMKNNYCSL